MTNDAVFDSSDPTASRIWLGRDHAVLVATVALATLLPPVVWAAASGVSWVWIGLGVGATAWTHRLRRAGGLSGVTTRRGKRFLYSVFAFYVAASVASAVIVGLRGPDATTSSWNVLLVLGTATAVGATGRACWSPPED